MEMIDEKLAPVTTIEGFENGINYKTLSTALPYMFTDTPEHVTFLQIDLAARDAVERVRETRDLDRLEKKGREAAP